MEAKNMSERNEAQPDPLRFPIGSFEWDGVWDEAVKSRWIGSIEELPAKLRSLLDGLSGEQLAVPYRPEGWNVRQVVHHLADSHMNSYIRFKLALTENQPTIKPYEEARWAELPDTLQWPVEQSVALLDALHSRWVFLLRSMSEEDYGRTFYHPASKAVVPLQKALGLYDWHGRHHLAHIALVRSSLGL